MLHTKDTIRIILVILIGIAAFAGCGEKRVSGLVQCEGMVTWKNEPVEGARVAFIPKGTQSGRSAFGITDSGGKFKTTTLDADDGIMPGEYFVTVTKRMANRSTPPPSNSDPDVSREGRNAPPPPREQIQETYFIPRMYANKDTAGLSATISSKGNKDLLFELVGEIENRPTRPTR